MRKCLERSIATISDRLVLLAPRQMHAPPPFATVIVDAEHHRQTLRAAQKLRGHVYLEDGAITPHELSAAGLHEIPEDDASWHLLLRDAQGSVMACEWYLNHGAPVSASHLRAGHCPLARNAEWQGLLQMAVVSELQRARREHLGYAEIGGWAVAQSARSSPAGLLLALAGYALAQVLGGALMMVTATTRHSSSTILRRLGGSSLEFGGHAIPSYFDPQYNCEMELLRFDSRRPNGRYVDLIQLLHDQMLKLTVIAATPALAETHSQEFVPMPRPVHAA